MAGAGRGASRGRDWGGGGAGRELGDVALGWGDGWEGVAGSGLEEVGGTGLEEVGRTGPEWDGTWEVERGF